MMGREVLAIAIAAPIVLGFAMAALVLDWKPLRQELGRQSSTASRSGRSLLMVFDEEILVELALWTWVVFVLWAPRPNYG